MSGMRCPKCQSRALTIDSRASPDGVRRRRGCTGCGYRWTTFEIDAERFNQLLATSNKIGNASAVILQLLTELDRSRRHD